MSETSATTSTRRLTVTLDRSLIGRLKAAAFQRDITMGEFVAEAVEEKLSPKMRADAPAKSPVGPLPKEQPADVQFPPRVEPPTPRYEFTPATCPVAYTHNSMHVCEKCGADHA